MISWALVWKNIIKFLYKVLSNPAYLVILCLSLVLANAYLLVIPDLKAEIYKLDQRAYKVNLENEKLTGTLKLRDTEIGVLKTNIKGLIASVGEQNAEIERLNKETLELEKRIAESRKQNEKLRSSYEKRIQDILNAPVPKDCQGALSWAVTKSQELSKWQK